MKRHIITPLIGSILGTLLAFYINQMVTIPAGLIAVIILFFILLSMGIGSAFTREPTPQEKIDAAAHSDTWAWLVPQTTKLSSGFPLNAESITVGRDVQNRIMLSDESVSRFHAEIIKSGEVFAVRDLGSTNGTFVNSVRVEEHLITDGDKVAFGDKIFMMRMPKEIKPLQSEPLIEEDLNSPGGQTFADF